MPRKTAAVLGPPIRAPMTTSKPEREASRIVVRRAAPQVDCLVVVIASWLLGSVAPSVWASPRRPAIGANPYSRPVTTLVIVALATLAGALAIRLLVLRRRSKPLEKLIEDMEKVDLSRPGPVLPRSID